jgi:hypothetical protein
VPKTIENCRIKDETFINDLQNDAELQLDLRTDEISKHLLRGANRNDEKEKEDKEDDDDEFKQIDQAEYDSQAKKGQVENEEEEEDDEEDDDDDDDDNDDPKILITTTELRVSFQTYKLCRELSRILPNAKYFYRKNVRISKVIPEAIKRKYSAIIVVNEDRKVPSENIFKYFC